VSTNFYGCKDGAESHLGQSAAGWEFLFHADTARGITGIQPWLRQLETFDSVKDEYGRDIAVDDLLEWVENRRELKRRTGISFRDEDCAFADFWFC
jgi:hypothetical protein